MRYMIKRYEIGSDDDELTADVIDTLPTHRTRFDLEKAIVQWERSLNRKKYGEDVPDSDFIVPYVPENLHYQSAIDMGWQLYASLNASSEFNEIVYLVKE